MAVPTGHHNNSVLTYDRVQTQQQEENQENGSKKIIDMVSILACTLNRTVLVPRSQITVVSPTFGRSECQNSVRAQRNEMSGLSHIFAHFFDVTQDAGNFDQEKQVLLTLAPESFSFGLCVLSRFQVLKC